jgi:hypothetical protein
MINGIGILNNPASIIYLGINSRPKNIKQIIG